MKLKTKIFHDTVHGSILIPSSYCTNIIDTLHFQRLKRIEQTSMRSLFPCARHDRFIHSLGTYHMGCKIFETIKIDSQDGLKLIFEKDWNIIGESYKIACLLHDCGHAPFSHTFEKYYNQQDKLDIILKSEINDKRFYDDLDYGHEAKEHEKVSAIIAWKIFKEKIIALNADPDLVVRMIIGCIYLERGTSKLTDKEKLSNCFIKLLNGHIVDADRLDYIKRDKWASGYNTAHLDVDRLLSSFCIKLDNEEYKICFHKKSITEIPNLVEARDFQSSWIFSHHKIKYDQYLFDKAVHILARNLNPEISEELAIAKLFNTDSFFDTNYAVNDNVKLYLPSDDDIIHLLKADMYRNPIAQEWFSREHKLKPLWKSYAEYCSCFKDSIPDANLGESKSLHKNTPKVLEKVNKRHKIQDEVHIEPIKSKGSNINPDEIFIFLNDKIFPYNKLIISKERNNDSFFFYVFVSRDLIQYKQDIIKELIQSSQN